MAIQTYAATDRWQFLAGVGAIEDPGQRDMAAGAAIGCRGDGDVGGDGGPVQQALHPDLAGPARFEANGTEHHGSECRPGECGESTSERVRAAWIAI